MYPSRLRSCSEMKKCYVTLTTIDLKITQQFETGKTYLQLCSDDLTSLHCSGYHNAILLSRSNMHSNHGRMLSSLKCKRLPLGLLRLYVLSSI